MTSQNKFWRRAALALCVATAALLPAAMPTVLQPPAFAAAKTVFIPERWRTTGEVPWAQERTRESNNFILLWGEKSGTNPLSAPAEFRFDPANVLSQLESLYSFYVNTMRFTPETGLLAQHKIIVIVTRTWNRTALDAWATGGSTDGRVGVINIAPAAAAPGSWGLAHELGHVFQNYTFLGRSGMGLTHASAGTFWEASAEFMAMQVYPNGGAGDLTRWLRTENLTYSSSRHHYGAWMLAQYIKDRDGIGMFNRIWNEARNTEHPLEVYRRITGITQAELNRRMGEYAQRNVTWDYSNRAAFMPFIQSVYGAGFLNAYKGVPVDAVNASLRHYRISDAMAPSDYGYNKIQLVPDSDGALIRLHLKGHAETGSNGWTFGFVAVRNGVPRYGPLTTSNDGQISFQTQSGESQVFLVVTGTPTAVPKYAFLDGWPLQRRYPYEFRISGAIPDGHQPGYVKPAAVGGRWHANGGGWVSNSANVAASAYVGPRAAVFSGTVNSNARIEDLAWVNGGTVTGNAIVRHNAIVQGGVTIGGSAVIGGDAEPPAGPTGASCTAGTYLMFNPSRACNGGGAEADVNPAHGTFSSAELAITGGTDPTPSPSPSTSPSPNPGTNLARSATAVCSFTSAWESCAAVNNGDEPTSSNFGGANQGNRWGTWPNQGEQWAELQWSSAQTVSRAQVYLFDDNGGIDIPASWRLQYWNGSSYVDVPGASAYQRNVNQYNTVTFSSVSTTRLRVLLQSASGFSVGLLEVKVFTS
ncbi:DUF6055 domain-containing protein [Catellatospora sichuanensis]|uniref:DUF6055 domain-containing protein n=1 Tax=Catellatospora sichuanensis TaxID=1969805 RepID=UPI001642E274|nr:DUF6055 domain-containing protein [Catellatospora sichuanensis]